MTKEEIIQIINKHKKVFDAEDMDKFFTLVPRVARKEVAEFLLFDVGYPIFEGFVNVPNHLFAGSDRLNKLTIPSNVKKIGEGAFFKSSLQSVIFENNGVQSIGNSAFESCKSLTEVVLPDSLSVVPVSCFKDCTNLAKVFMPISVTTLDRNAFEGCSTNLKIISPKGPRNTPSGKLQIPLNSVGFYKTVFREKDE